MIENRSMQSYAYWGTIKDNYHFSEFNAQSCDVVKCLNEQFTQFDYNSPLHQSHGYRSYGRLAQRAVKRNDALSHIFHIYLEVTENVIRCSEMVNLSISYQNPIYQYDGKAPIRQNRQLIAFNFKKIFTSHKNFNQAIGLFETLVISALDLKQFSIIESDQFQNIEYYHGGANNTASSTMQNVVVLQNKIF